MWFHSFRPNQVIMALWALGIILEFYGVLIQVYLKSTNPCHMICLENCRNIFSAK